MDVLPETVLCLPAVLGFLSLDDVPALREVSRGVCEAATAFPWPPPRAPLPPALAGQSWRWDAAWQAAITGGAQLVRWRRVHPHARGVYLRDDKRAGQLVCDDDLALAAGAWHVGLDLSSASQVTDAGLTHLRAARTVALHGSFPLLTPASTRAFAGARSVALHLRLVEVGDAFLAPLARVAAVHVTANNAVTDAGVAQLRGVRELSLKVCRSLTGAGFAGTPHLRALALSFFNFDYERDVDPLAEAFFAHCGRVEALTLACVYESRDMLRDGHLAPLSALREAHLMRCDALTDAAFGAPGGCGGNLVRLHLSHCQGVAGADLTGLARLEELTVEGCHSFTGRGLHQLRSLKRLVVRDCPQLDAAGLQPGALSGTLESIHVTGHSVLTSWRRHGL
jgi:hypothetical protein